MASANIVILSAPIWLLSKSIIFCVGTNGLVKDPIDNVLLIQSHTFELSVGGLVGERFETRFDDLTGERFDDLAGERFETRLAGERFETRFGGLAGERVFLRPDIYLTIFNYLPYINLSVCWYAEVKDAYVLNIILLER